MDEDDGVVGVNLDALNPKQKAKEFKSAQKGVKAKDEIIRLEAWEKLQQDERYYTEGGCLHVLIGTAVPKKKNMDFILSVHQQLLKFVERKEGQDASSVVNAFKLMIQTEGNASALKTLSDSLLWKEEIKKPKKPKKGQPPVEPKTEDEIYGLIRSGALKCLYHVALALYALPVSDTNLKEAYSAVDSFMPNLCDVLTGVLQLLGLTIGEGGESSVMKAKAVQDGIYALHVLLLVLRHNPSAVRIFQSGNFLKSLFDLAKEPYFTLYCTQILEVLSREKAGVDALKLHEMQEQLVDILEGELKKYTDAIEAAANVGGKDTKKKEEKPKKGAPVVEELNPMDTLDMIKVDPIRSALAGIKMISKIFVAITTPLPGLTFTSVNPVDVQLVDRLGMASSRVILNPVTHKVMRAPNAAPLDEDLGDIVDQVCIMLGNFGIVSATARKYCCNSGALQACLATLHDSEEIISGKKAAAATAPPTGKGAKNAPSPEPEMQLTPDELDNQRSRINQLRRVAEKASLNLLTQAMESPLNDKEAEHVSHGIDLPVRWLSCFSRNSDGEAFELAGSDLNDASATLDKSLTEQIVDLISVVDEDVDLAIRGVRIFAAILHGHKHPVELIESKQLHTMAIEKLSAFVQIVGQSLVDETLQKEILSFNEMVHKRELLNNLDMPELDAVENDEEYRTEEELEAIRLQQEALDANEIAMMKNPDSDVIESGGGNENIDAEMPAIDILVPCAAEGVYLALSVVELLLMISPEVVNAFATTERILLMSQLLRCLGPIGATVKSFGGESEINELEVVLHDPRRHSWNISSGMDPYSDNVLMRPLLFDILTSVVRAGNMYRDILDNASPSYPVDPLEPLPATSSSCEEVSLSVCHYAGDACCAVLLYQTIFSTQYGHLLPVRKPQDQPRLLNDVQDSALRLLLAIAECGARGVSGAVEGIAAQGFAMIEKNSLEMTESADYVDLSQRCAMRDLVVQLSELNGSPDINSQSYKWERPLLFDEVYTNIGDEEDTTLMTLPNQEDTVVTCPIIWPWITFCAAFMGSLIDPRSPTSSCDETIKALMAATRDSKLQDNYQFVISDIIAATFLSLGGGVVLAGLVGRCGNISSNFHEDALNFADYLLSHGRSRSSFWRRWEEDNREEIPIDPKTGKPIKKKDDKKKDAKADKKKEKNAAPPSIVPEIVMQVDVTEEYPDPNHGPGAGLWKKLLEVYADDHHLCCPSSSTLVSLIQGGASQLADLVVEQGVDVNQPALGKDNLNLMPIMYSLILGDEVVTEALIKAGADCNALDQNSAPVILYAMLSLHAEQVTEYFTGHCQELDDSVTINLFGRPNLLALFLQSDVDVNVRDPDGNSPILMGLGRGSLNVIISGYKVHIRNESYNNLEYPLVETHTHIGLLLAAGSSGDACNRNGLVPIHVASGRGDVEMIKELFDGGSFPNTVDNLGYTALHFLAACCPTNAIECFDLLIQHSANRHLENAVFEDYRTGLPATEKDQIFLDRFIEESFKEAIHPSVVTKRRLNALQLLNLPTSAGMNILQLCFAAPVLLKDDNQFNAYFMGGKDSRMDLALHILACESKLEGQQNKLKLLRHVDPKGLSALHAASYLFQGMTPQIFLTERQKKQKRVRMFVSKESELLFMIAQALQSDEGTFEESIPSVEFNSAIDYFSRICNHTLVSNCQDFAWTPMHAAIYFDNPFLIEFLLEQGFDVSDMFLVHFMAQYAPTVSSTTAEIIIKSCADSNNYKALLNESYRDLLIPIHIAVRNKSLNVLQHLVQCHKVDLNLLSNSTTGHTAFHEACLQEDILLVQAFQLGSDRLDLLMSAIDDSSTDEKTPLESALQQQNVEIIMELIVMRPNDVIQQLLQKVVTAEGDNITLLAILEKENFNQAKALGADIPDYQNSSLLVRDAEVVAEEEVADNTVDETDPKLSSAEPIDESAINPLDESDGPTALSPLEFEVITEIAAMTLENEENGADDAGQVTVDECIEYDMPIEETFIDQTNVGGKLTEEEKQALEKFRRSNDILRLLIDLLQRSSAIQEEDHIHEMYHRVDLIEM